MEQLVARKPHKLEVTGSSPVPATNKRQYKRFIAKSLNRKVLTFFDNTGTIMYRLAY